VLYNFTGGNDGSGPSGALARDKSGNLYGTADNGGAHGYGTVFELAADGTFSILHSFTGGDDGGYPIGDLLLIGSKLYGVTGYFGASCGCGTIYSLKPGSRNRLNVLHSFLGAPTDGNRPLDGLALGPDSLLYGTTSFGGANGSGAVFSIGTK
jgi:uncharacterized repeat protein (TIGR03803 family)